MFASVLFINLEHKQVSTIKICCFGIFKYCHFTMMWWSYGPINSSIPLTIQSIYLVRHTIFKSFLESIRVVVITGKMKNAWESFIKLRFNCNLLYSLFISSSSAPYYHWIPLSLFNIFIVYVYSMMFGLVTWKRFILLFLNTWYNCYWHVRSHVPST